MSDTHQTWISAYARLGFHPSLLVDNVPTRMGRVFGDLMVAVSSDGATITASIRLSTGEIIEHKSLAADPTRAWDLLREAVERRAKEMLVLADAMRPPVYRGDPPPTDQSPPARPRRSAAQVMDHD